MRAVIQRVEEASVKINKDSVAEIGYGILIFVGIEVNDDLLDVEWLSNKIAQLRIFSDLKKKMNKSIIDINGDVLVVSQFTLHAKTKKGNRPSYIKAASAEKAIPLYKEFKRKLTFMIGKDVKSGIFGSDMKVSLINDGPITIIIDTKNKD